MLIREASSAGGSGHNEDLIAVFQGEAMTDVVIMDGATSVANRDYIDSDIGDPAWFVRRFAHELEQVVAPERSQEASIRLALLEVRTDFKTKTVRTPAPAYAWPIAAMTWVRVVHSVGAPTLHIYALGDCKLFLAHQDGSVVDLDPYSNPQEAVLQKELSRLSAEGVLDPEARRERLLPMLRARREQQNVDPSPIALCLEPRGPFDARTSNVQAARGSLLLAMTDGFHRLVDTYKLCSIEELAYVCAEAGPAAALDQLRAFEASGAEAGTLSVKNADDASAVTCRLP